MSSIITRNGLSNGGQAPTARARPMSVFNPPTSTQRIDKSMASLQSTEFLWYPKEELKYHVHIGISSYNRSQLDRVAILNIEKHIRLPLPLQLIDNHHVNYTISPLQAFGVGAALLGYNQAKTQGQAREPTVSNPPIIDHLQGAAGGAVMGGVLGALAGRSLMGGAVGAVGGVAAGAALGRERGTALGQYIGASAPFGAGAMLQAFAGYSPNQFLTILLSGPQYKRNEFVWKLSPNSPDESRAINKIIRLLNNSMAPGITGYGLLFTFPKVFTISFNPNSQYLFKMKPCILENMTVNYSGGGRNSFLRADSDTSGLNAPESVEIRLRFMELEFWLADDFKESNDPSDVGQ